MPTPATAHRAAALAHARAAAAILVWDTTQTGADAADHAHAAAWAATEAAPRHQLATDHARAAADAVADGAPSDAADHHAMAMLAHHRAARRAEAAA